jgi:hypothetical protein
MRTLAILANLGLLICLGLIVLSGDFALESSELPLLLFMIAAPVLSIVTLLLRGVGANDWLSRYFERRALKERQKLDAMRSLVSKTPGSGNLPNRDK